MTSIWKDHCGAKNPQRQETWHHIKHSYDRPAPLWNLPLNAAESESAARRLLKFWVAVGVEKISLSHFGVWSGIPSLDQNVRLDDGDNSGYVCIVTVVIIITLAMYNSIIHYYTYGVLIDIGISINRRATR